MFLSNSAGDAIAPRHFGVNSSFQSKTFHMKLTIIAAKGLINTDSGKNGDVSDPYCVAWLGGKKKEQFKTRVIDDNLNPVWDETFEIPLEHNPEQYVLICQLYDKDTFTSDDSLGFAAVSLSILKLKEGEPFEMWLNLQGVPKGSLNVRIEPLDFSINDGFVSSNSEEIPQIDLTNFLKEYKNEKGGGFSTRGRSLASILSGNISEKESHRLDKLFGVEYLEDVYDSLRTGDVLLHSGKGNFSKAIQLGFSSTWSHLSVIIRNPPKEVLDAYNVKVDHSSHYSTVFVAESETDTVDNKEGGGIQLVELRRWFLDYLTRDPTDLCCLRRLNIPSMGERPKEENITEHFPSLVEYLKRCTTKKYETSKSELLKCVIKRNTQSNDSNVFCSEFVAECYTKMGLLPQNTITCNYGPRDFSQESNLVNTVLLKGANLTPEKRVRVKEWDKEHDWAIHP
ncbi:predicted protein [Naegleria gruberi]|uniref:Predicted protein n=1 Tax=Naegleria gruberi TaxID=5762 RepID=D2VPJ0_NAEGR|nr:uncharacterized protein NAEGRDRAFT_70877 [Naegleria gruberi]EFC41131.1 predicted protein [Naegleria gruberi]|eukprot:XP_002673875.1 predicted protein [Naegleria gruberi strain NEG-M]